MVLIVASRNAELALKLFEKTGQRAWVIGEVIQGRKEVVLV